MTRLTRSLAVLVLLLGLLAPARALAQDDPFTPLPQAQQPTQTQTVPDTADNDPTDDGGLSRFQEILIFLVGVGLIVGIGWLILRDARSRAPATEAEMRRDAEDRPKGTRADPQQRKTRNRSKGKAQRRARKHNR